MYYDRYSILLTIKLPLPLYSKTTSSLASSECPVCHTYGPYLLWFWQNLLLLLLFLDILLEDFLLWLLEFHWSFVSSFALLLLSHFQSIFSHFSSHSPWPLLYSFHFLMVSPIPWLWPLPLSRWLSNFCLQPGPHTTTSDPYVQQPTRHLHRMTHRHLKFTVPKPLLPPKTCLDPIRENTISSHSCLDLWSSHTFHGLNIT